jgi:hypothetical protein
MSARKLVISFAFIVISLFITPFSISAQTLNPSPYTLPPTVSPTSPLYTDLLVNNLFHSFSCLAIGQSVIDQPCLSYLQGVPVLSKANTSGGALGATTSLIGMLYANPPVRTADYLASIGEGMGIVKTANAQVYGSGAAVLRPILDLWRVSRNISYVIMIVIFVVIGLMIMFRNKLNPQTVITAQAALPGLVIGLILITFSYFLAGLITDVSFLGINIVGAYFSAAQPNAAPKLVQDFASDNIMTIFSKYVGMISQGDIASVFSSIMDSMDAGVQGWIRVFAGIIAFQTGQQFGQPLGAMAGAVGCSSTGVGILASPLCGVVAGLVGGLITGIALAIPAAMNPSGTFGLVFYFVVIAITIYTMLKLVLKLVNNYLQIIFLTISAPFQFLFASLPGRQSIVTGWILSMLCNVLAFPAVFAVLYFVAYLWGPNTAPGNLFNITAQATLTGKETLPFFGGLNLSFIRLLLAFGALLATPSIPDVICRALGRASQAGQMIGQEISGGVRSGQGYAGQFGNRIGGTAGSLGKTIGGETQYVWNKNLDQNGNPIGWEAYTGSPGFLGKRGIFRRGS